MIPFWTLFTRKKAEPPAKPDDRPKSREGIDAWMDQKVAYYAACRPEILHHLFCPSSSDYIPLSVHVEFSREEMAKHIAHYLLLKRKYPTAASKALANVMEWSFYKSDIPEDYPKDFGYGAGY